MILIKGCLYCFYMFSKYPGTGQDGGECHGKAIGEVDPSTLGKTTLLK